MPTFRTKPVIVTAVLFDPEQPLPDRVSTERIEGRDTYWVQSPCGRVEIEAGHYLVIGPQTGDLRVFTPEHFTAYYEPVE